jgi:hypothetical protein
MDRDAVPQPIKLALRQEAGFGCCFCGNPIFQYHHVVPYSKTPEHIEQDMMVVCPNHHHEITVGGITEERQRHAKANPINIKRGYVDGLLRVTDPAIAIRAGTVDFVGPGFKLLVDDKPLLGIARGENGRLSISLELYDSIGNLLLAVGDNEWISGDPLPWDIEFGVRRLKIRRRSGEVVLKLDARHSPATLYGDLWFANQHFSLRERGLFFDGVARGVGIVEVGLVGGRLHADSRAGQFRIEPDPAIGNTMIFSWPYREQRLKKCFKALAQLEAEAASVAVTSAV